MGLLCVLGGRCPLSALCPRLPPPSPLHLSKSPQGCAEQWREEVQGGHKPGRCILPDCLRGPHIWKEEPASVYVCVRVQMCVRAHKGACVHLCANVHVCTHVCRWASVCKRGRVCTHKCACMYSCVHPRATVCAHKCALCMRVRTSVPYAFVCANARVHIRVPVCMHVCIRVQMCARAQVCLCAHSCANVLVHTLCVCVHVCVHSCATSRQHPGAQWTGQDGATPPASRILVPRCHRSEPWEEHEGRALAPRRDAMASPVTSQEAGVLGCWDVGRWWCSQGAGR